MRSRFISIPLLLLPFILKGSDSVYVADEIMLLLPGLRAEQAHADSRQLSVYQSVFQVQMVEPLVSTKGVIMWWGKLATGYWLAAPEVAMTPPGKGPHSWQKLAAGASPIHTWLAIGTSVDCWIRFPGKEARKLFSVSRPALVPVCGGYTTRLNTDTAGLRGRVAHVSGGAAEVLSWRSLQDTLLRWMADETVELYFRPPRGMPDSSLEYQLQVGDNSLLQTRWQRTGHLLRLPPLPAGSQFILHVRYPGMPEVFSLSVRIEKYWYQQAIWRLLLLFMALVAVALFYFARSRRRLTAAERRNSDLQNKLQLMNSQLNPHFVYNAISSMAGIVAAREFDKATIYLSEFGQLLREVLKYSQSEKPYTLREELRMLDRYCHLEQLRFGFRYHIHTDPEFRPSEVFLPPLLVQPLVENAILHGAQVLQEKGEIGISYLKEGANLVVRVTDNGPGLSENSLHRGFGMGLDLTRKRIAYLGDLLKMDIRFSLTREDDLSVATIRFFQWFE